MTGAKKGSLAGLIDGPASPAPPMPAPPGRRGGQDPAAATAAAAAATARKARARTIPDTRTPEVPSSEVRTPNVRTPELPKYKRLERKDVLLWPDQLGELSVTRRRLNRQRGGAGERITENTLIRVAVALLLSRAGELAGTTEDELRQSLGLG